MGLIDQAVAHLSGIGRQRIEVPEWGKNGEPAIVTWTPITVLQQKALTKGRQDADPSLKVDLLIMKAEDENGAKLFQEKDRQQLMTAVAPAVIDRVAAAMLKTPTVEEAEKNS